MLEPQGKQILRLIGKDPGAKGIILPTEMNAAIAALQAAVALEELAHQELASAELQGADAQAARPAVDGPRSISLKQRVVPLIDMLRRAQAEDKEVVWGV
jgi:hypothetical protein